MAATAFPGRISSRTRTVQAWPAERPNSASDRAPATPATANVLEVCARSEPAPTHLDTARLPVCGEKVGGHCVLRGLLGEGAFGRVFAAEDEDTGQQVALKVVGLRRYPREYAEHELRALAAIAHPNVVQLNEHGVEASASEPYLWYTMPLYRGSDLAATLKGQGNLSLSRAHAIITRIAGGVCEMHSLGLRHQDIKPDNIYLANMAGVAEHHPVLLDLGGAARENTSRPLVATFPFAAPEQSQALIGGLLGEHHPPVTEKVDVYALAGTLLFALIGEQFAGHEIAQSGTAGDASPGALLELRAALSAVHAARAEQPLPAGALPYVTGAVRERLSEAFRRWLALDPLHRPSARAFVTELSVLLEWDAEVLQKQAKRELRSTLLRVAGGLSLAACVGGLVGYQWHERTMGAAKQATSAALRKANEASDELNRASSNLDEIIADKALGPVDKARKITEVVKSLEAQTASLVSANAQLQRAEKAGASQARVRAQQERVAFDSALAKAQTELEAARNEQSQAESARWKAEAERDQARTDQATADGARVKAERDTAKSQQDRASAEAARSTAEAERDHALQTKAAEVSAAFAEGFEAGAARNAPASAAPAASAPAPAASAASAPASPE